MSACWPSSQPKKPLVEAERMPLALKLMMRMRGPASKRRASLAEIPLPAACSTQAGDGMARQVSHGFRGFSRIRPEREADHPYPRDPRQSVAKAPPAPRESGLAHELRLQAHLADTVDPAVDVVVAFDQADVAHPGAHLHHQRRALDLQVLDH